MSQPNVTKEERKKARKEKRELKKKERARKRASGDNVVGKKIWKGVKLFFKGVWKLFKGFFKYVLFPFWYTGVLILRTVKFLKVRNDDPLTKDDKNFLSLIPTLFFTMSLSIAIVFLMFRFEVFDDIIDLFLNNQFWAAIGQIFVTLGEGIWWWVQVIFVNFFYNLIIVPITSALTGHDWITAVVLLGGLILLTGLSILIYNFSKRSDFFKRIGKALKKVFLLPKKFHDYLREEVVLKHFVGQRYIENRTKKFFWLNVLMQSILSLLFGIFSLYLGISKYFLYKGGDLENGWDGLEVLNYALFASLILFLLIGIFSTWFFSLVHGVSTMSDEEYETNKKRRKEKKQQRIEAKSKKQEEKQIAQEE